LEDNNLIESIILGGGCFWCLEAIFGEIKGIEKVVSGYSGGNIVNPTYDQVCSGRTNHAEVVQLNFYPEVISLKEILEIFFSTHDPTTLNSQGPDVGTQYRSIILYKKKEEREIATEIMNYFERVVYDKKIVTELIPLDTFYPAEEYHQNYYQRNPLERYCQVIISPKLTKMREKYHNYLK
jgi:peptide-methionine (S)-S-oxide reductase